MPLNLFIDTNIFLSFFHLSSDDLEELRKLSVLLAKEKVKLYLPAQVVDEFARNRDAKVADGMKRLGEQRLNLQFPQMCKDYPQYKELRQLQRKYEETHNLLLEQLKTDIASEDLKADIIVRELFDRATRIETSEMIELARTRMDLGNPPRKTWLSRRRRQLGVTPSGCSLWRGSAFHYRRQGFCVAFAGKPLR